MTAKARHLISILITVALFVLPIGVDAQDSPAAGTDSAETQARTGSFTFQEGEDASLFVGYYRLNPGDTIRVEIVTDSTLARDAMIDDEGFIVLPILGPVQVADLTITEAREALQKLADEYYRQAWVTVRIVVLGRVKFYVYGDFEYPGFYTASGATTIFDFLQRFELASRTDHRRIVHVRGARRSTLPEPTNLIGEREEPANDMIEASLELFAEGNIDRIDPLVTIVDPLDFTLEGEIEQRNFYLEYGDVIHFPDPDTLVTIEGFRRPGDYEVLPDESWVDLIRMAGQPAPFTDISSLILERHDENGRLVQLYYNLNYLDDEKLVQVPVMNRDRLIAVEYEGNVYVFGAVNTAGAFEYSAALNPMDYLALAGGPTSDAHLRFGVIVRTPRDPSAPLEESTLIEVDLVNTLTTGAAPASAAMQPGDILFIPDQGEVITFGTVLSSLSVFINAVRLFE